MKLPTNLKDANQANTSVKTTAIVKAEELLSYLRKGKQILLNLPKQGETYRREPLGEAEHLRWFWEPKDFA